MCNHRKDKAVRKIVFPLAATLLSFTIIFLFLEILIRILPVRESLNALSVDSQNKVLRFKPDRDITWSHGPNFSIVTRKHINNYGFLNDCNYNEKNTLPLMAVIGDSYVEAAQVSNKNSMHGKLAELIKDKGEIYSFGSSGSQLSTYLAYAEFAREKFQPDAYVFIIVGNDFDESLFKYKSYPGYYYYKEKSGELSMKRIDYKPSILKRYLRYSAVVRYLFLNLKINLNTIKNIFRDKQSQRKNVYIGNTASDYDDLRLSDSKKVVDKYFDDVREYASDYEKLIFVVDGIRPQLYNEHELQLAKNSYFGIMRDYFMSEARSRGCTVIDMQPYFIKKNETNGDRFEFPDDNHWNELGHALVADKISDTALFKKLFE